MELNEFMALKAKKITSVETYLGYMQVLEYTLQDFKYLHVVQWHFNNTIDKETLVPAINNRTFYQKKNEALKFAHDIAENLLDQYN